MTIRLISQIRSNLKNLTGLFLIQGSNAIFPLVVMPFAYAKIDTESFAKIAVSESFILIVLCLVLYSHDIQGVQWLNKASNSNSETHSQVFSRVFWARLFLLGISIPITFAFLWFYDQELIKVTAAWMPLLLGHILYSAWFFQANEDSFQIGLQAAVTKLIASGVAIGSIWLNSDPILIPLVISCAQLASGALALKTASSKYHIKIEKIPKNQLLRDLKDGRHIFAGNFSVLLFRGSNTLILNHFSSSSLVAAYALGEKIIKALQATLRPVNQLLHIKLLRQLSSSSKADGLSLAAKYSKLQVLILLSAWAILGSIYVFTKDFGFFSQPQIQLTKVILLMWPATVFGTANFLIGNAALNAVGQDREYSRAVLSSGTISLASSAVLISQLEMTGAIISYVLGEALLLAFVLRLHSRLRG